MMHSGDAEFESRLGAQITVTEALGFPDQWFQHVLGY
jgi:hypothetical protein